MGFVDEDIHSYRDSIKCRHGGMPYHEMIDQTLNKHGRVIVGFIVSVTRYY